MRTRLERRFFSHSQVRALAAASFSSSPGTLESYSATFNSLSSNLGGFKERIAPGCFDRSISRGDDVRALIQHDPALICGRTKNGTLRLLSDQKGLRSSCDLPNTTYARDLMESCRRQDISDCSFGFTVDDDGDSWCEEDDPDCDPEDRSSLKIPVRTLRSVSLADVSWVTYPAYPNTSITAPMDGLASTQTDRSHSFEQLFPDGLPKEIRSHVGHDVRAPLVNRQDRRRRLTDRILSI
jgi:HK97 family phage prohead protease